MDRNQKERLLFLKKQQKQQNHEKLIRLEKEYLISEHIDFLQKYRFADAIETNKVNEFLNRLPAMTPVRPDFSKLQTGCQINDIHQLLQYANECIWICCLCGSRELTNLYSYGRMASFVYDFEHWYSISEYLLLIQENYHDFFFIGVGREIIKSNTV